MIDLHCHLLPGIDDGAVDMSVSIETARMAVADGITHTACTPHIQPGVYNNTGPDILQRVDELRSALEAEGIELQIWGGADVHIAPDLQSKLRSGSISTLGNSRYFLFEPPTQVVPLRIADLVVSLVESGYVPILTHPERLRWIETHYDVFHAIIRAGALVQLTAASVTRRFGQRANYWAERMLDEGLVDILATDAHNTTSRPPVLSQARDAVARRLGEEEAMKMVWSRPALILNDEPLQPVGREAVAQGSSARPDVKTQGVRAWLSKFRK